MTPFRYPGSKAKIAGEIIRYIPRRDSYLDLFVGGGSMLIALAQSFPNSTLHANDADSRVAAFWDYIATSPDTDLLCEKIREFNPTPELFRKMQDEDPTCFTALALNRCAFSGILHASPIGGMAQKSEWDVGCRYNPDLLIKKIRKLHRLLHGRLSVTNLDFANALRGNGTFVYADPPYFKQGKGLYKERVDHIKLLHELSSRDEWVLSYDACDDVRDMYSNYFIKEIGVRYCGKGTKDSWDETVELLISHHDYNSVPTRADKPKFRQLSFDMVS